MVLSKLIRSDWACLSACILIPQLSRLSCILSRSLDYAQWYRGLKKPSFTPPDWVYATTWCSLYLGMGSASYMIVKEYVRSGYSQECLNALMIYGVNLALNFYWPYTFFGKHNVGRGFTVCCCMASSASLCAVKFFLINETAGWLLVPYVFWSSFAAVLNYSVWMLNKSKNE